MNESFVHYVWQFQYFSKASLCSTGGDAVEVFDPGIRNTNAGPDFLNARVKVGGMYWVGNVEIHIDSSAWLDHEHEKDEAYDNVILHVVWKDNALIRRRDGSILPAIELAPRVEPDLLDRYKQLINSLDVVPCAASLNRLKPVVLYNTIDRMLASRLELKAREVISFVEKNRGDWSESTYQLLARNFGFKVNADPFLQLSQAVKFKTLLKHADKPEQVESILFGIAGFLDDDEEDQYHDLLKREFNILRQKYKLDHKLMNKIQWRFLRLRPANFPTLRIAQFAAAVVNGEDFFSTFIESSEQELRSMFQCSPSHYWHTHFHFKRKSSLKAPEMGEASIDNVIINSVVPVLAGFSIYKDDIRYMEKAISLLHAIPPEDNAVMKTWLQLDLKPHDAFDSQGLLHLYNNYCCRRRCLDCNIGASLIKP